MNNDVINSHDRSLLLRFTKNTVFIPLVKRIPVYIKPNLITLTGFFSVLVFCCVTLHSIRTPFNTGYLLGSVALLIYLITDNIDGMHARNTNQTSQLGGFLDQWLDGISLLLITMSLLSVLRVSRVIFPLMMLLMALVNLVLYYAQKQSGQFYKPAFGPNEFLVSIIVGYLLIFIFHNNLLFLSRQTIIKHTNLIMYVTILLSIVYIFKTLTSLKMEFKHCVVPLLVHCAVLIPCFLNRSVSPVATGIMITAVNSLFVGKFLVSTYELAQSDHPLTLLLIPPDVELKTAVVHPSEETLAVDKTND